jgi:hypothetical protein
MREKGGIEDTFAVDLRYVLFSRKGSRLKRKREPIARALEISYSAQGPELEDWSHWSSWRGSYPAMLRSLQSQS